MKKKIKENTFIQNITKRIKQQQKEKKNKTKQNRWPKRDVYIKPTYYYYDGNN